MSSNAVKFSVVISTLNEGDNIAQCLRNVKAMDSGVEIIVSDGGSNDNTVQAAKGSGALIVHSEKGRGIQFNAGARIATGDIILFLHADTRLPKDVFRSVEEFFTKKKAQIGTFKIAFWPRHCLLMIISLFLRFDSVFTRFGDQCIVVRHTFFDLLGGFPDWPLFEDTGLMQVARRLTKIYLLPGTVVTSSKRFNENGVLTQLARDFWYMVLYLKGDSPWELAKRYES